MSRVMTQKEVEFARAYGANLRTPDLKRRAGEENYTSFGYAWDVGHFHNEHGSYPGNGGTMHVGTDRYPITVLRISGVHKIIVQEDEYRFKEGSGPFVQQEYDYFRNPAGKTYELQWRNGRWMVPRMYWRRWSIGTRSAYRDPHI